MLTYVHNNSKHTRAQKRKPQKHVKQRTYAQKQQTHHRENNTAQNPQKHVQQRKYAQKQQTRHREQHHINLTTPRHVTQSTSSHFSLTLSHTLHTHYTHHNTHITHHTLTLPAPRARRPLQPAPPWSRESSPVRRGRKCGIGRVGMLRLLLLCISCGEGRATTMMFRDIDMIDRHNVP